MEIKNKKTTVSKGVASVFRIRHNTIEGWADVFLTTGDSSVSVMINSDYGVFSYSTEYCSRSPIEFIANVSKHYILKKLLGDERLVVDEVACRNEILDDIRRCYDSGSISECEAKVAVEYIDELQFNNPSLYYYQITNHDVLGSIYNETDSIPDTTTDNSVCEPLWNDIWLPFANQLKQEIKSKSEPK